MKSFQIAKKNFEALGISSNQSRFNGKLAKTCLIYSLCSISSAAFLFFEAECFIEYTSNIYVTTALTGISTYFIFWILKLQNFFNLIDNLEKFFEESEYFFPLIIRIVAFKTLKCFRIWKSGIESKLWQNWSASGKMVRIWIFCHFKNYP